MLSNPTVQQLRAMKLEGMAQAYLEQVELGNARSLSFEERFGLLVEREVSSRDNRGFLRRLQNAKLKQSAVLEDLDYRQQRNLDEAFMRSLASCAWLKSHHNLIITGPTGVGKTYLSCALAHQACRLGYSARYAQLSRLLSELQLARADGRYPRLLTQLAKTELLVLDDWGLENPNAEQQHILLELLDDRYDRQATLITSQFPTELWFDRLSAPTLADAILDRILHNSYRLELSGESMRKTRAKSL